MSEADEEEAETEEPKTLLGRSMSAIKKVIGYISTFAGISAALFALWEVSSGLYGGAGTAWSVIDGIIFMVCVWLGFMLGYGVSRYGGPKGGSKSSSSTEGNWPPP